MARWAQTIGGTERIRTTRGPEVGTPRRRRSAPQAEGGAEASAPPEEPPLAPDANTARQRRKPLHPRRQLRSPWNPAPEQDQLCIPDLLALDFPGAWLTQIRKPDGVSSLKSVSSTDCN